MIEQAKFAYSPLGKAFEKQTKAIEEQRKKLDAITDENKRVEVLTNKDDHKRIYKKIFDRVVKEIFDEIKELTYETDHDDVIYYLKNNTNRNFNDFDDGIELLKKIQSGEMKLEDGKELRNIFESNLNDILKGRFKSEEQKSVLKSIKLFYELRQAVIKLFNEYFLIGSQSKHKEKYGERMKILTPKQMLQRLLIALAQVKAGNTSENLLTKRNQTNSISFVSRKRNY